MLQRHRVDRGFIAQAGRFRVAAVEAIEGLHLTGKHLLGGLSELDTSRGLLWPSILT